MEAKTAYERLKEYEARGCHMLIPSAIRLEDIAQGFALVVETVLLNPRPRNKEVYADNSSQYDYQANDWKPDSRTGNELVRIHKQGFDRLAQAAKIDWLPPQIIRDGNFPGRMMANIEGMIRTSTGELYRVSDAKGMDLDIEKEKLEFQYSGKEEKQKKYLVDRDLLQKKAFQTEMCISGAKNRVVKQLLCVANAYSVADLAKEFVVVRIVPKLDTSDEYTRKRLVDLQLAAMAGIYGLVPNAIPQKAIEMVGEVPAEALRDDDAIDAESVEPVNAPPEPEEPPVKSANDGRVDFANSGVDDQCACLIGMAKNNGATAWLDSYIERSKKPLEAITPAKKLEIYDYLSKIKKEAA